MIRTTRGDTIRTLRDVGDYVVRQQPEQRWDSVIKALLRAVGEPEFIYDVTIEIERALVLRHELRLAPGDDPMRLAQPKRK